MTQRNAQFLAVFREKGFLDRAARLREAKPPSTLLLLVLVVFASGTGLTGSWAGGRGATACVIAGAAAVPCTCSNRRSRQQQL
jgi:hypothetical protein